jgi:hypothetical protein
VSARLRRDTANSTFSGLHRHTVPPADLRHGDGGQNYIIRGEQGGRGRAYNEEKDSLLLFP